MVPKLITNTDGKTYYYNSNSNNNKNNNSPSGFGSWWLRVLLNTTSPLCPGKVLALPFARGGDGSVSHFSGTKIPEAEP